MPYLLDLLFFSLTTYVAYSCGWQVNELCWQFWLASLLCGWLVIVISIIRTLLHVSFILPLPSANLVNGSPLGGMRKQPASSEADLFRKITPPWGALLFSFFTLALGVFVAFHFTFFHFVQAVFMTIFVPIEPRSLFNPDTRASFGDIIRYLLVVYWPLVIFVLISRWRLFAKGNPGSNLRVIYGSVVRMHIFILLSAFLGGVVLHYGKQQYDQLLLGILLFLFYFPWPLLKAGAPKNRIEPAG